VKIDPNNTGIVFAHTAIIGVPKQHSSQHVDPPAVSAISAQAIC